MLGAKKLLGKLYVTPIPAVILDTNLNLQRPGRLAIPCYNTRVPLVSDPSIIQCTFK
jgi:hypothetical protein